MALTDLNILPDKEDLLPDPLAGLGLPPRRKKSKAPPLPPEEQKSVVRSVLETGAGGLQMLGDALDYAGSHVRGVLAGKPGTRTSGRDLLEQYGMVSPNVDQGWLPDRGDLAGFAADTLTDPLTYLTLGGSALTKAGGIAKAAGLPTRGAARYKTLQTALQGADLPTVKSVARAAKDAGTRLRDIKGEQLGGLFGLKMPFGPSMVPGIAKTESAQKIGALPGAALGGLGNLAVRAADRVNPVVGDKLRQLPHDIASLTDPAVQGFRDPLQQEVARHATKAFERHRPTVLKEFVDNTDEYANLLDDFYKGSGTAFANHPAPMGAAGDVLRRSIQLAAEKRSPAGVFDVIHPGLQVAPDIERRVGDFGDKLVQAQDYLFQQLKDRGIDPAEIKQSADFTHFFRQTDRQAVQAARQGGAKLLSTGASGLEKRQAATKFVPAEYVNKMLADPQVLYDNPAVGKMLADPQVLYDNPAVGKMRSPSHIAAYINNVPEYSGVIQSAATAAGKTPKEIADDLAGFIHGSQGKFYKNGTRYYNDDILKNHLTYSEGMAQAVANADATHGFFKSNLTNDPTGNVPVSDAFQALGWDAPTAMAHFDKKFGQGASLGYVPADIVAAAKSVREKMSAPEWMKPITELIDDVTGFYKKNLTLPFPAFHARNLVSGQWMNLASNDIATPADLLAYKKAVSLAKQAVADPAKHKALLDEMVIQRAIPLDFKTQDVDVLTGAAAHPVPKSTKYTFPVLGQIRGTLEAIPGMKTAYQEARAAGKGKLRSAAFAPYTAMHTQGAEMAKQIEYLNRAPMYLYLKSKGWSPEAAAARVRELQIDYGDVTQFERGVMKRLVPFYTFTRKNVPQMLRQIYERPGGMAAQTVRASNAGRSDNDFIPAYIGEGMSVELPSGGYLSEFGLPTDALGDLVAKGPSPYSTVRRTSQKVGAMLHPLVKAPIEMMTGTNMFTGKKMTDLYQYPTDSTLINQAIGASPFSRLVTTGRFIGDERKTPAEKALSLTTGMRVSHPSGGLDRQRDYAAKTILDEMLREHPEIGSVSDLYVKQGQTLSPEAERLYRAYRGITREQTKARKKEKGKK